jgi:adenosylhomocysteine nucleosidase
LETEVAPLTKDWSRESLAAGGRSVKCFLKEGIVVATGGIGAQCAEISARALVEKYRPELLVSVGLAGALTTEFKIAGVVLPERVIDAGTGFEYSCETLSEAVPHPVLVTAPDIADPAAKSALVQKFHASIVDMEAAGVARVAREKGIAFRCIKAISDERGFCMPPVSRFIKNGEFQTVGFLRWLAFHPHYWGPTIVLGRNSARASRALCNWLAHHLMSQPEPAELLH